jgi:hypothetical protein
MRIEACKMLFGSLSLSGPFLINTPLQRGGRSRTENLNRFSGFLCVGRSAMVLETAKAVGIYCPTSITPLKRGVNERVP